MKGDRLQVLVFGAHPDDCDIKAEDWSSVITTWAITSSLFLTPMDQQATTR